MNKSLQSIALAPLAILATESLPAAEIPHRVISCNDCNTTTEFRNTASGEASRWRVSKGMLVVTSQNAAQSALFRIQGTYIPEWGATVYNASEINMGGRETLDTMLLGRPAIAIHNLPRSVCDCSAPPGDLEEISAYLTTLHINDQLGSKVTVVYPNGSRGSFKKKLSSIPFQPIWRTFVDAEGRPIPGLNPEARGKKGKTTSEAGPIGNPYPPNPFSTGGLDAGTGFIYSFGWFGGGYDQQSSFSFSQKW